MRTPLLRHLLTVVVTVTLLSPLFACGEDKEKHAKDCAARCEPEKVECEKRKEKDCEQKHAHCLEACRK
jgi:hypothetical protein